MNKSYKFRNNQVILLGDSHSPTVVYHTLNIDIPNGSDCVHLGDVGLGFGPVEKALDDSKRWLDKANDLCTKIDLNLYLIIGNHDNPLVWNLDKQYSNVFLVQSGDVGIFPNGKKTLFVGGGISVDRYVRKEGIDYWKDEVTPYLDNVEKSDIVFAHDCPEHFNHSTASLPRSYGWYCERDITLMDEALKQRMNISDIVARSKAKTLFSGHFHNSIRQEIDGIYYRCIDINERFEFDADKEYKL